MTNTSLPLAHGRLFSVAPMMDMTDRHCRFFHRQMTRHAVLYTEMITARAIMHGNRQKLLSFDEREQPVVLQLGGSEPAILAEAARIGEQWGYRAINLNVGCPSDKVQEGRFGACLMAEPHVVAECIAAMQKAVRVPVTVKCRIGIDDQDDDADLQNFVETVSETGCETFIVHARKAWLQGLSPKENREIPPLNYGRVHRLKKSLPHLTIILNGGLESLEMTHQNIGDLDGVMLGRAPCNNPWMLTGVDPQYTDQPAPVKSRREVVEAMIDYAPRYLRIGVPLHRITRQMLGLFHGQPGGRLWRQMLSGNTRNHGVELLIEALDRVEQISRNTEIA